MAYTPQIDFLAVLRQTSGGVRTGRVPGLDYVVAALARAGMFNLVVSQTAPTTNQPLTAWLKPALPSYSAEGAFYLWDASAGAYEPATPALWSALLEASAVGATVVQDVAIAGPTVVQTNANVVRVLNVGAAVALTMPLAANMGGPVLIVDWANHAGANKITITLSGGDMLPNGLTTWEIDGDGGSVYLRPVPGGFAL